MGVMFVWKSVCKEVLLEGKVRKNRPMNRVDTQNFQFCLDFLNQQSINTTLTCTDTPTITRFFNVQRPRHQSKSLTHYSTKQCGRRMARKLLLQNDILLVVSIN